MTRILLSFPTSEVGKNQLTCSMTIPPKLCPINMRGLYLVSFSCHLLVLMGTADTNVLPLSLYYLVQ